MVWRCCSVSQLLLRVVQLILLVSWLVLTALKIDHFLSEPTALRSRLDSEFQPPYVTIFPALALPLPVANVVAHGTPQQQNELFANQTLDEFIRLYSMPMVKRVRFEEALSQEENGTTLPNRVSWRIVRRCDGAEGVTMTPTEPAEFFVRAPRNTAFRALHPKSYYYALVLHGDRDFFRFDPYLHSLLQIRNEASHPNVKIVVEREEKLNLRRQPCDPDPNYGIAECERRCFMARLGCSMERDETKMKPLCMASNYSLLLRECVRFYSYNATSPAPVTSCGCLRSCAQDRISYSTLTGASSGNSFTIFLQFSVNRLRRTMITVPTFDLEDLLAYMGGYLGLLLGSSILSLFVSGNKMVERLSRHVARSRRLATRNGRQGKMEEEAVTPQRVAGGGSHSPLNGPLSETISLQDIRWQAAKSDRVFLEP